MAKTFCAIIVTQKEISSNVFPVLVVHLFVCLFAMFLASEKLDMICDHNASWDRLGGRKKMADGSKPPVKVSTF